MYVKRLLCAVLLASLVFAIPFQASASPATLDEEILLSNYDLEQSIQNAEKGIIDSNVSDEVLKNITVSGGENVTYTVECLGKVSSNSRSGEAGTMYALTATEKIEPGTNEEDNVFAWLTLIWIDHLGTNNEIHEISGGWEANGRTLSNREVIYSAYSLTTGESCRKRPTSDAFHYTDIGLFGLTLTASSSVESGGYTKNPITVSVTPTIFD